LSLDWKLRADVSGDLEPKTGSSTLRLTARCRFLDDDPAERPAFVIESGVTVPTLPSVTAIVKTL
jgi:hypothetical protein